MKPLNVTADFDGTLAYRDEPLANDMANLIVQTLQRGGRFNLLTGRNVANVRQRFVDPLLLSIPKDSLTILKQVRLFTCEGTSAWHILPEGTTVQDADYCSHDLQFATDERRELLTWLQSCLQGVLQKCGLTVTQSPEWWDSSLLLFKVTGELSRRDDLVTGLGEVSPSCFDIRIGIAGQTSIVIARKAAKKSVVFAPLLAGQWKRFWNIYIADEFVHPGNDHCTIGIPGLIRFGVDRDQDALPDGVIPAGAGVRSAERCLSYLSAASLNGFQTCEDLIRRVTAHLDDPLQRRQ